jgi:type 1 glutamine amidotransferase
MAMGGSAMTGSAGNDGAGGDGLRHGPFRMLVLSTCLEFVHDSIGMGQAMLTALGQTPDDQLPAGAAAGSQFTVNVAQDDLSEFTDDNLKKYEILFWMNPTGTVFTSGGTNGSIGRAAIQQFMENGGAWAGVHSASDFEKTGGWSWFQDQLAGAYVDHHDIDGTAGTVIWDAAALAGNHPAIRGIASPWTSKDEWYFENRNPADVAGFTILGRLASDQRPVSWVHELPGGGRAFYTIRGHNKTVYAEPEFIRHVHQGILWAVHRLK